jgi:hypothetical protein
MRKQPAPIQGLMTRIGFLGADAILKDEGNPWHRYCRKHWGRARWALQLPTIPFVTGRNSLEEMAARALLCIA